MERERPGLVSWQGPIERTIDALDLELTIDALDLERTRAQCQGRGRDHGLAAARGALLGLFVGALLWLSLAAGAWRLVAGGGDSLADSGAAGRPAVGAAFGDGG